MKAAWLTSDADLERFSDSFGARTSNPLDPAYLAETRVRGFWQDGDLVGGYIVNAAAPWRYMDMVPEARHTDPRVRKYLFGGKSAEIACMWLDRRRVTPRMRYLIYMTNVRDQLRTGRKYIVAGSLARGVAQIHRNGFRRMVYAGEIDWSGAPQGEIYATSRWELAWHSIHIFGSGLGDLWHNKTKRRANLGRSR